MSIEFELDHIAIAVETLDKGKSVYEALGLGPMNTELVPTEKVNTGFFDLANGASIELLEPTEPDSPVGKFIQKRGPGIHHICLRVKDIRAVMGALKAQGIQLIDSEPKPGAHGCLVAFIHPKSTGGVLIELSEPQERGDHQ